MSYFGELVMQYQKMHSRHLKAVVQIEESVYDDPWTLKQLKTMLPNEEARCFVAVKDKTVAGYIIICNSKEGWAIENLTVAEEFRRQMIGTELLSLARKTVGLSKKIQVYVADKYLEMHLLLKNFGYRAISVEKGEDGDDYYIFISTGTTD